ncbi:MAG: DUF3460 family protein [Herminiimonas sp.]|nr:DUF3460 family protein [Herminiimonas sp.]
MKFSKQFPKYESEATLFIKDLKAKNPGLEASQRAGRALLWDKNPVGLDQQARDLDSSVKQQSYVYQNNLKD